MSKLNISQFSRRARISRTSLYKYFTRGYLVKNDSGEIDLSHPVNFRFLEEREIPVDVMLGVPGAVLPEPAAPAALPPASVIAPLMKTTAKKRKAQNPTLPPEDSGVTEADIEAFEQMDLETLDIRSLRTVDIQNMQRFEALLKSRQDRERVRKTLIERELVTAVLGKIYTVDVSQFKGLGARLISDLAGIAGVEDNAKILKMEEKINDTVGEILEHVKRLHDDWLAGLEED